MHLFVAIITFIVTSTLVSAAQNSRNLVLVPVDSPFETQFTNPPTTWIENTRPIDALAHWKRHWEDFRLRNWFFPPKQAKQLDFFRLRASEFPTFLSVRTLPASVWQKSPNSILRNGELISSESATIKSDHLVVEVLESRTRMSTPEVYSGGPMFTIMYLCKTESSKCCNNRTYREATGIEIQVL